MIRKNLKDFNEEDLQFLTSTLELFENRKDLIYFEQLFKSCKIIHVEGNKEYEFSFKIDSNKLKLEYHDEDVGNRHYDRFSEIEFELPIKHEIFKRFEDIMIEFNDKYEKMVYNKFQRIMDLLNKISARKRKLNEKR
jgi:hypothetical protein